jgi:hypothetical protein
MKLKSIVSSLALAGLFGASAASALTITPPFEVWTIDQSRTDHANADGDASGNRSDGGILYIFNGKWTGGINPTPSAIVDMGAHILNPATNISGNFNIGQRPHIGGTNFAKTHMTLSWFGPSAGAADGGISIFRVGDRKLVWSMFGLGMLHMPGPAPDDKKMAGVAIGDQKLYLFNTDYATETFSLASTTALNTVPGLTAGLGTTAAAPICSNFTPDSKHLFVTFRDGGMAVFNVEDTAAPVLKEVYPASLIPKEGCGLIQHPDGKRIYTGSGAAESGSDATFGNIEYYHVWNMETVGNGLNDDLIASIDLGLGNTFADGSANPNPSWGDNHGPQHVFGGKYLWVTIRIDSTYKVIDTDTNQVVATVDIKNNTVKGKAITLGDPTPDVLDRDPINPFVYYVSLRGYCPVSGAGRFIDNEGAGTNGCPVKPTNFIDPTPGAVGRTPGQAMMVVGLDGKSGKVTWRYPMKNVVTTDPSGNPLVAPTDITDPHAGKVVVRSKLLPPQ